MLCLYHTDLDGFCSGAIVKNKFPKCRMFPINYNLEIPFSELKKNEELWIVDFSFEKEGEWEKAFEITNNIYWIDHHISHLDSPIGNQAGGIRDDSCSGAMLTWKYVNGKNSEIPKIVKLVSDYDTFTFDYPETIYVEAALSSYNIDPQYPKAMLLWHKLLYPDDPKVGYLVDEGKIIIRYRRQNELFNFASVGFECQWEGYRCLVASTSRCSVLYDALKSKFKLDKYDILVTTKHDGKLWTISLSSLNPEIDVSKIALNYGGGGHKGASGFQCRELPKFKDIKQIGGKRLTEVLGS